MAEQTEIPKIDIEGAREAFYKMVTQRIIPVLEFCPRAGYCAYDCHFYIVNPRDELIPGKKGIALKGFYKHEYSLSAKIFGKLVGAEDLTQEILLKWLEMAYKYCSMCDRCSVSCPYSLINPPLTYYTRGMLHGAGLTPPSLLENLENELTVGHPLGITKNEWTEFIKKVEKEEGITVPVDVQGADYLYLPGNRSLKENQESIKAAFKIFNHLGLNWTVSSELRTASLFPYGLGAVDELTELVKKRTRFIENMNIKTVVVGSDGMGYYAWRWESGRYLGRRPNFNIMHISELLAEMLDKGKLKLKKIDDSSVYTYHDPCFLARKGGVVKEPRKLIHALIPNFREMPEHGIYSYCCTAGCQEVKEYKDTRLDAFKVKLGHIEKTAATKVLTFCDMCNKTIKEGLENYGYDAEVIDLTVLISKNLA